MTLPWIAEWTVPLLRAAMVSKLETKLENMIQKADARHEVTVTKLKRAARCKASTRTMFRALHDRGVYFRPLRQKPVLTPDDIADRKAFAQEFGAKSVAWWNSSMHMIIDVKQFRAPATW